MAPKTRSAVCKSCGVRFDAIVARGRPRLLCDACDLRHGDRRKKAVPHVPGQSSVTASTPLAEGDDEEKRPDRSTWSERLALGLSLTPDPRRAAISVGLHFLSDDEIRELEPQARLHTDLVTGQASGTAKQLHVALGLSALELRSRATSLGPGVLASSVRAITQALESFQGGSQRIFSKVEIHVPAGHGESFLLHADEGEE